PIPAERAPLDDSGGRSRRRYGEGTAALGAGISARLVAGEVAGGQTVGTVVAQTHGSAQPSAIRFSSKGAPVGTAAPHASQPRTSHLELRTPLRREPGRDREVGREQLTDQHEEERDVEKSGGRVIRFHVGRLPDEVGKGERTHDSPQNAKQEEQSVALERDQ